MDDRLRFLLICAAIPVGVYLWSRLFSFARGWVADLKPGPLKDFFNVEIF